MSLCEICSKELSKYKCPSCQAQYCTIACYKIHTSICADNGEPNHAVESKPENLIDNSDEQSEVNSTIAQNGARPEAANPFEVLKSSSELQDLFATYPDLRSQLHEIYLATLQPLPDSPESQSRGYGRFDRGRGRSRGRGRGRGAAPWTPDRGTQEALNKLKLPGDSAGRRRDGIQEFCQLVAKLCGLFDGPHEHSNDGTETDVTNALAALLEPA